MIEPAIGAVHAVLQCAPDVREGVVSLAHGFEATDDEGRGASSSVLVDDASDYDALSGLPRMSAVPVRVRTAAMPGRGPCPRLPGSPESRER